ncbi:hypothetical protein L6452_05851 [Arctium lappa]|uniref:Uncharacterized protein n=1 Tax=Arctium lappa TaxID=4217 RepID=A0ACB9EIL0_ARCLA|nr:hypothetical protein L6452_05851 [Arctium lappa]
MAPSPMEPEASVQRKIVVLPSSEPEPVYFAGIVAPLSQDWNSPTVGKEVDMASTKKSEVLADMPKEVRRYDAHESNKDHSSNKPADNATCMTTFAYFVAPSYNVGITPQKIQSDPRQDSKHEEDKRKCIEKGRRKSEILFMSNMSKSICRKTMQSLVGDSIV